MILDFRILSSVRQLLSQVRPTGLLPAFLEWSLQVRSDHIALVGATWGGVALLASRRRPALAVCAGLCFGIGWLSSQ